MLRISAGRTDVREMPHTFAERSSDREPLRGSVEQSLMRAMRADDYIAFARTCAQILGNAYDRAQCTKFSDDFISEIYQWEQPTFAIAVTTFAQSCAQIDARRLRCCTNISVIENAIYCAINWRLPFDSIYPFADDTTPVIDKLISKAIGLADSRLEYYILRYMPTFVAHTAAVRTHDSSHIINFAQKSIHCAQILGTLIALEADREFALKIIKYAQEHCDILTIVNLRIGMTNMIYRFGINRTKLSLGDFREAQPAQ